MGRAEAGGRARARPPLSRSERDSNATMRLRVASEKYPAQVPPEIRARRTAHLRMRRGRLMAWSVTVTDPQSYGCFDLEDQEGWAREHEAYPRDAALALGLAQSLGLKSATLAGGRTPSPYGDDEIVMVTVTGSVKSQDFLALVKEMVLHGPEQTTPVYRHYAALSRMRSNPCRHHFRPADGHQQCDFCKVNEHQGMMWFDD